MLHARARGELHAGFWWGELGDGDHLEDAGLDRRIILKMDLQEVGCEAWTGLIWLRIAVVNVMIKLRVL